MDQELEEHFVYSIAVQKTRLQAGDILVVIGTGDASAGLRRDLQPEWET